MEPRIQYAKTGDGVSIAFWTLGEGMPFVAMPGIPFSHLELEWQLPELRGEYLRHAETKRVIRYDSRGAGLSGGTSDYSLDSFVLDLEAVVDELSLGEVCLYGAYHSAPVAIAFAARHPERVSKLVLLGPYTRWSGDASPTARVVRTLLDKDWDLYLETRAEVALGSSQTEPAQRYATFCRGCTTQDAARAALAAVRRFDVSELLSRVNAPALLIHQRQNEMEHGQAASKMASQLPNARLVVLDSEVADYEPMVKVIDEFLDGRESPSSREGAAVDKTPRDGEWKQPIARTPMVGRHEERARLRQLLEKAIRGDGSLAMISGEAGVGKTRLVEELAAEGPGFGVLALTGHCYESEEAPYVPFVEILQSGLRGTTQEAFREGLGKYAGDVAKLMPELRRIFADIPAPLELPPEQERRYLFNSLSELLEQASRGQPLLLAVEDLHWADSSTLMLFQHIVRRLQGMRVLLICTYRDTEIDGSLPFKETLAEIVRRRLVDRFALKRLSPPDVKAVLDALGGGGAPEPVVQVVYSETEGNPFFVEEVFKHLAEEGKLLDVDGRWLEGLRLSEGDVPESIRLVLGRRIQRLSEQCRNLLVQAAIIGRDFNTELLHDLSGGDRNSLLETLEEAERSHLIAPLREPRGSFAFAHELVRQTILSNLSGSRRQRLHLRVADAIEARYVTPKGDDRHTREQFASRLAYHYYQAATEADPRKSVRYLTIAGERAMSAAAFEDAFLHFDRAVSLIQPDDASRAEPLFGRGLAKRSLGQWEGALADWRDALSCHEQLKNTDAVGRVAWSMTIQLLWGGRYLEALEISRRGLIGLGERVNADRCMLLGAAGLTISFGGYHPAGSNMITQALAMAESMGDERLLGRALTFASVHHLSWMEYPQAIETGLRSAGLLRPHGDLWFVADALWAVQDAALGIGQMEEVARLGEELEDLGSRLGHQAATLFAGSNRALRELMRSGDIDAFEEFARNDVKLRRKLGFPWVSQCYTWMGFCEFWRGRWEEAIKHFDESLEVDDPAFFTGSAWAFVFMAGAYTGRREKALTLLERYRSSLPKAGQNNTASAWTMLPSVVEGLTVLGERHQAAELSPVVEDAIRTGTVLPWDIGQLFQLAAAMAASAARDWDKAEEHYELALRQAEEIPVVIQQPEVRRWYARMLLERRHRGDRRHALQLISQAIEEYRRIGMPRHVEMAQTLGGGPQRDQRQRHPDGLTEREVEILRLVAEGSTSREIGDELVLSMRTVERHITNIYAKINAHTRAQATAYALARGLSR